MPEMPEPNGTDCRHGHGAQPHAVVHLVLGSLSGRQPNSGHIRGPTPTAVWASRATRPPFSLLHKLRAGMVRPDRDRIGGRANEHVEADEAWVGGRTRGRRPGRSSQDFLVVCAVEVRRRALGTAQDLRKDGRYAGRVRLAVAADRSGKSLVRIRRGRSCARDIARYRRLERLRGLGSAAMASCRSPSAATSNSEEFLPIIHLVFTNLKTWLTGTHHGVTARHLQAYLNEFTFDLTAASTRSTLSAHSRPRRRGERGRPTPNYILVIGRILE